MSHTHFGFATIKPNKPLNPKPKTPNPKPKTQNPKPHTHKPQAKALGFLFDLKNPKSSPHNLKGEQAPQVKMHM